MQPLLWVARSEFERVLGAHVSPQAKTALFADLCRINTLYMITRAGSGHIGTSFSCLDIFAWLFLNELGGSRSRGSRTGKDLVFSSKGHDAPALYSVLIALGLLDFDLLHRLRRLDGLPGHPDVSTSCIETNTGSLGMGISKAKGMALARRLRGESGRIFVVTGDGELQEGQIWESLISAANRSISEITVIVDHNKVQSDTFVSDVSDLGDLEAKFESFGWHAERCNGHDLDALSEVLARLKAIDDRPKVIVADTIKGRGVSFMEHTAIRSGDLYRYHSGAPDAETYERALGELLDGANARLRAIGLQALRPERAALPARSALARPQRLIPAYSRALVALAEQHPSLVVLDADLLLDTGLMPFRERFPARFFECGIAEQDMVSQAGGMALQGALPVVHSFACFLAARANEQIYNNATEGTRIVYVGSLAGVLPGGPGHSHQAVRDISALAAVPDLLLLEPCCEEEVAAALEFCVSRAPGSSYLRLVSIPCEIPFRLPADYRLDLGKGVTLKPGDDAILFGYGPVLLSEAVRAADLLAQQHGIGLEVVNLPWLNHVDAGWLATKVRGARCVFTLDNHFVTGGQGDCIAAALAERSGAPPLWKSGLRQIPVCGTHEEVLAAHGLDAASLAETIARRLDAR